MLVVAEIAHVGCYMKDKHIKQIFRRVAQKINQMYQKINSDCNHAFQKISLHHHSPRYIFIKFSNPVLQLNPVYKCGDNLAKI
jgi:hypothetical protein